MLASVVAAVSACASESQLRGRPASPRLPRVVATSLAARSDVLAAALRRGDGCGARIQMHGLERQTRLAIDKGRIPVVFRPRLLAAEQRLAARVPACVPPAPPPPPPPPPAPPPPAPPRTGHGKKHEHHHEPKKKHGHGGSEGG